MHIERNDQYGCIFVAMLNIWFGMTADMLMFDSVSRRHRHQRGAIRRPASPCGNGAFRRPRLQRDLEPHLHRALLLSRCLPTVTDVTGRSADSADTCQDLEVWCVSLRFWRCWEAFQRSHGAGERNQGLADTVRLSSISFQECKMCKMYG